MTTKCAWRENMKEISGMGGDYEEHCRKMLLGGLEWFEANPNANPSFTGFKDVFGFTKEENDDARSLGKAIEAAGDNNLTGAMYHAVVGHLLFIIRNGWDKYCDEMSKKD